MKRERQAPPGTYNKGVNLRGWRHTADMTQEEVCDKLGITQATLSRIERGQIRASADFIQKVAKIYHVDVTDVLATHPDNEAELQEAIALLRKARPDERIPAIRAVKAILSRD